jgi:hypothetical protein
MRPGSHDKFLAQAQEVEKTHHELQMEFVLIYIVVFFILIFGIPMAVYFRQNCQRVKEIKIKAEHS